jgi:DNA-binding protein HU-beta
MTKAELIDKIAQSADVPKAATGRVLDAALDPVKGALKKGQKFTAGNGLKDARR